MSGRRDSSQPSPNGNEFRVERKRTQNRIAQQHAREKQLARIRELESFVDRIKSAVGEEDTGSDETSLTARNAKLTKAFMELLDENASLKQGLLRLRKAIMTLSTQAADGAGDAIYKEIDAKSKGRTSSRAANLRPQSQDTDYKQQDSGGQTTLLHPGDPHEQHDEIVVWDNTLTPYHARQDLDAFNFSNTDDSFSNANSIPKLSADSNLQSLVMHRKDASYCTGSHTSSHEMMVQDMLLKPNPSHLPEVLWNIGPFFPLSSSQPNVLHNKFQTTSLACIPTLTVSEGSSSVFDNLERVLSLYISNMEHLTDAMWTTLLTPAVRLLFSWTRLEEYAYCLGLGNLHESIVRWRLEPTAANRAAIRPPFRPTDLQSIVINTTRYSPWLDFIPWPEFRDQVLFRKGSIDPAEVLQDILNNMVLELPHLGVAVPQSALFLATRKKIVDTQFQNCHSQDGFTGTNTSHGAIDTSLAIHTDFTPDELSTQPAVLMAQIKEEMDAHADFSSKGLRSKAPTSQISRSLNSELLNALQTEFTAKHCVEDTERWKLRPAMGVKYPFIRTSGVQTIFPVISAGLIVGC